MDLWQVQKYKKVVIRSVFILPEGIMKNGIKICYHFQIDFI